MAKAIRRAHSAPAAKHSKYHASASKHHPPTAASKKPPHKASASRIPPNLLVTIDERHRERAGSEIVALLARAGYADAKITAAPGPGLIGVHVETRDARGCIPRLKEILLESPFEFQHTHRWLPVETWAAPDATELAKFAKLADAEIGKEESWAIVVERHDSHLDRGLIVNTLAKDINNPNVSLDSPQKTIMVEIVGTKAAMTVLGKDEQLSVDKAFRDDFVQFEEVKPFREARRDD